MIKHFVFNIISIEGTTYQVFIKMNKINFGNFVLPKNICPPLNFESGYGPVIHFVMGQILVGVTSSPDLHKSQSSTG